MHITRRYVERLLLAGLTSLCARKSQEFPEGDLGVEGTLPCLKSPGLGIRNPSGCIVLGESCPFTVKCDEKEANLLRFYRTLHVWFSFDWKPSLRMITKGSLVKIL